jgi:hypothetical protein
MLTNCRPDNINRRARPTRARQQKSLKLRAIPLPPSARIKPHKQTSQPWIHFASSLSSPTLANRCSVPSFARRIRLPSAVIR